MIGYMLMAGAMFSFVALAFVYRGAESRKANRAFMASAMGAATALLAVAVAAARGVDLRQGAANQWVLGSVLGVILAVLIPVFMAAVARGDLSITWTLMALSFALPSGLSLIYPGERLTAQGVASLLLAGLAVGLLGLDMARKKKARAIEPGGESGGAVGRAERASRQSTAGQDAGATVVCREYTADHGTIPAERKKGWGFFMALTFVLNGVGLYTWSLAAGLKPDTSLAHPLAFMLASGVVFAAVGLVLALARPWPGSVRMGVLFGGLAGASNGTGTLLSLLVLSSGLPGYIFYAATNGGSSVLVVVLSVVFLKERPGRWGWLGISAGAAALTLAALAA